MPKKKKKKKNPKMTTAPSCNDILSGLYDQGLFDRVVDDILTTENIKEDKPLDPCGEDRDGAIREQVERVYSLRDTDETNTRENKRQKMMEKHTTDKDMKKKTTECEEGQTTASYDGYSEVGNENVQSKYFTTVKTDVQAEEGRPLKEKEPETSCTSDGENAASVDPTEEQRKVDYAEEDGIFSSVDPETRDRVLIFIASHPLMRGEKPAGAKNAGQEFVSDVRNKAGSCGLDRTAIGNLLRYVQKVYSELYDSQSIVEPGDLDEVEEDDGDDEGDFESGKDVQLETHQHSKGPMTPPETPRNGMKRPRRLQKRKFGNVVKRVKNDGNYLEGAEKNGRLDFQGRPMIH